MIEEIKINTSPKKNDNTLIQKSCACVAHFYPLNPVFTKVNTNYYIEDDAIISCTIVRDKNSPNGDFELILRPKKKYDNVIKAGDWVLLYLDHSDKINLKNLSGLRMIGSVTRVAENRAVMENGSIQSTYSISGSDWGKILDKCELFYDPYIRQDLLEYILKATVFNITGGPVDYVSGYLDLFLGNAKKQGIDQILYQLLIPQKLYDILPKDNGFDRSKNSDVSFNDVLIRDFRDSANDGYALTRPLTKVINGSLWNLIIQACNRELNELYLDTKNGSPVITMRKQPLTKQLRIERLNETIGKDEYQLSNKYIVNYNLGTSDHALFNYIILYPSDDVIRTNWITAAKGEFQNDFPQINRKSIQQFGMRKVELTTDYGWSKEVITRSSVELLLQWIRELGEYWLNYYRFENGTIQVLGKHDFYIGDYYRVPETNKCYIVESIQWVWQYQSPISVSLGVTHGVYSDGKYIDEIQNTNIDHGTNYIQNIERRYNDPTTS